VLKNIRNGSFSRNWMTEHRSGNKHFEKMRSQSAEHPIEAVGKQMRQKMLWLKKSI